MPIITTEGLKPDTQAAPTVYNVQWAEAIGSGDVIQAFYDPPITTLYDGLILGFRASAPNSTATPTFSPDGLTPHKLVKNGNIPLQGGDLPGTDAEALVRYNVDGARWELLNPRNPLTFVPPVEFYRVLSDNTTGQNNANAQPWFPTNGSVTLAIGSYWFEGFLGLVRSAGTTSHTTSILYGGTATVLRLQSILVAPTGDGGSLATLAGLRSAQVTEDTFKAASTSATEQSSVFVRGSLAVSADGTFTPQFKYSTAPGGAPTIREGSYFRLVRFSDDPEAQEQGAWS